MSFRKVAVLLLLNFAICSSKIENNSMYINRDDLEGKTLLDPREDSSVLVFGYCNAGQCTFFREREYSGNYFDAATHLLSCSFIFNEGEVVELYPFGSNKIVFKYEIEDNNNRFAILNLDNCWSSSSSIHVAKIDDEIRMIEARMIVSNETCFQIAVSNYGVGKMCGEKMCKMTFDEEGNQLVGLHDWIDNNIYRSVGPPNANGQYIVVDERLANKTLAAYQVNEEGMVIRQLDLGMQTRSELIPAVSTTYGFVTTCSYEKRRLTCRQYNATTGERLIYDEMIIPDVKQLKLHNLSGGGFLILISKCPKTYGRCESKSVSEFEIARFRPNRNIEHLTNLTDFSADFVFHLNNVHFFLKNDGKLLCLSRVQKPHLEKGEEQVVEIFCYNDESFHNY